MDRIAALRNIETALTEFEQGETDLEGTERHIRAVLRTYATEFDDDRSAVYRVGDDPGTVLVAGSPSEARERAEALGTDDVATATVERLSDDR